MLWVKRDDQTNAEYGGNKVRKLDFILADAQARQCDEIITFGATGTHHGLATALHSRALGLGCRVLLFPQPDNSHVRENLRQLKATGAHLSFYPSLETCLLGWALHPRRLRRKSRFVFAGGSEPLGVIAYVNAALELDAQIKANLMPTPRKIFCATSSLATLSGLTLGCRMAGLQTRVVGVRVSPKTLGPFDACTPKAANQLIRKTLKKWQGLIPVESAWSELMPEIWQGEYGLGYGEETTAAREAQQWFHEQTGLMLDVTYTAKAFAAVLQEHQSHPDDPLLYWHTLSH